MLNHHHNTLGRQAELKEGTSEDKVKHTYRIVYVPIPVCMECGTETRDMYPICNTCAEDL